VRGSAGRGTAAACAVVSLVVGGCAAAPSPLAAPSAADVPSAPATAPVPDGCVIPTQTGVLPSDRLVDADVTTVGGSDRIAFRFGAPSDEIAESRGTLRRVDPPFFEGGSGARVAVAGSRFIEIRFDGLLIVGDDGVPIFQGERDRRLGMPAITEVAVVDEFEGVMTWIVGIRGPGCVVLGGDAAGVVTVDIRHG